MRVEVSEQVADFIRAQPPDPRRNLRLALRKLAKELGDIRALEGPLQGFWRLWTGPYRVVFAKHAEAGKGLCIRCVFAERRDVIYAVFSDMLK